MSELSRAFGIVYNILFSVGGVIDLTDAVVVARNEDDVVICPLSVNIGDKFVGTVSVIIPCDCFQVIEDVVSNFVVQDKVNALGKWRETFLKHIDKSTVPVRAVLTDAVVKVNDVASMYIGKCIMLGVLEDSNVTIRVNDRDMFLGKVGKSDNNIAIQISDVLRSI